MNAVVNLLNEAREVGVNVALVGGSIRLVADTPPPPELIERMRMHRDEIMGFLSSDERAITDWLNANPEPSTPGTCAHCGRSEQAGAAVLPFGVRQDTHTWLHPECWKAWNSARRDKATAVLREASSDDG